MCAGDLGRHGITHVSTVRRWLGRLLLVLLLALVALFWLAFISPRPPLTIDPATLAGDGSQLNYCELPELDGTGLRALDIAKGNTPGCGYQHFPLPILAQCTEPLIEAADDIRGLWQVVEGEHIGHVERVEQCGARVVITTAGLIHDSGPNSTAGLNTNDTEGAVLFSAAGRDYCMRTSASMVWEAQTLNFYAFGWGPKVVRRYREGEDLIWEYADGSINRMQRLCQLPPSHRQPAPRGLRLSLFGDG